MSFCYFYKEGHFCNLWSPAQDEEAFPKWCHSCGKEFAPLGTIFFSLKVDLHL